MSISKDKETILASFHKTEKIINNIISCNHTNIIQRLFEDLLLFYEKQCIDIRSIISHYPDGGKAESASVICRSNPESRQYYFEEKIFNQRKYYVTQLPFLLPNRRTSSAAFKRGLCYDYRRFLSSLYKQRRIDPISHAAVVFITYYADDNGRKHMHDNDNTEISIVLNAITGYLIPDDGALCCDLIILSKLTDEPKSYTMLYVCDSEYKADFMKWLQI